MLKIFDRFLTYLVLLFLSVGVHAQLTVDSVFNYLNEDERLSLLFFTSAAAQNREFKVVVPPLKTVTGTVIDVSDSFKDSLQLPFPGFDVLKCIPDTSFTNYFYQNSCDYFTLKGAKGIVFKKANRCCTGVYDICFMGKTDNGYVVKNIAVFDGLPLLGPMKNLASGQDNSSFSGESYDIKFLKELFSADDKVHEVSFEELLKKGYLFLTKDPKGSVEKLKRAIKSNDIDSALVAQKAEDALRLRMQLTGVGDHEGKRYVLCEQKRLRWKGWVRSMSIVQRSDVSSELSFMLNNASYGILDMAGFYDEKYISKYTPPEFVVDEDTLIDGSRKAHQIVIIASADDTLSVAELSELNSKYILKLIYSGSVKGFGENWLAKAGFFEKIMTTPKGIRDVDMLVEQAMFGGIPVDGTAPFLSELKQKGFQKARYEKIRLGYAFPELAGMNPDTLEQISGILNEIVKKKMAPGGQLLIARNGYVILDCPFGYTTYSKKQKVEEKDLYDLASLTKIIVTIPEVMKLYESKQIELDKRLKDYLPETDTTEAGDIVIKKMLLHEAGLPSFIPFHLNYVDEKSYTGSMYSGRYSRKYNIRLDRHFFFNRYVRYRKDVFSHKPDSVFSVRLSKNMYMNKDFQDSIYYDLVNVKLHKKKEYRYSDLGYYFLRKIIQRQTGKDVDQLFRQWFAIPLGTERLVFNPLDHFPVNDIVPSGKDMIFRKEMLQGYPNDAGAAMQGGVAGHAGLFGNADDIAKFAQMMLNKGTYGGVKFLEPSTIELFTSKQNDHNRRGLGFDKPEFDPEKESPVSEYASRLSYGHSGFTGTLLWIDPKYDLVYIFLSNRVYPYSYNKKLIKENVRTRIQDIIYRSIATE